MFSCFAMHRQTIFSLIHSLPHNSILQRAHSAKTRLRHQLRNTRLLILPLTRQLRHLSHIKPNLQRIRSRESRLNSLPNLLLGVQHSLGLALPTLKKHTITSLGLRGRVDQLDGALVGVLALLDLGRRGEHHGARLDAAHGDGLQVAHGDDLAVLHLGERDEAVEARAHGADDLAFVLGGVVGAGGVAAGDGADVEGVGIGVGFGLEDVTDAEVDKAGGERLLGPGEVSNDMYPLAIGGFWYSRRGLLGLGLLLLLLLLLRRRTLRRTASLTSDSRSHSLTRSLRLILSLLLLALLVSGALLARQRRGRSTLSSGLRSSSLLLLLLALLLGLSIDGFDLEDNVVDVNGDALVQLQVVDSRVLDEVDEADDVVVALLAGALLDAPLGDEGSEVLVEGNVGDGGLCAQDRGAAREVRVQAGQALSRLSGIFALRESSQP